MHKSGFVNIIGNTNVGKSTLMNRMVGERVSVITSKAQTTRHRIMGIVNGKDFQIVYSDTPGLIKPMYKLQERMMNQVNQVFEDADLLLYITDVVESYEKNQEYLDRIKDFKGNVIIVINKIDLTDATKLELIEKQWHDLLPEREIWKISALKGNNVAELFDRVLELMPEGPKWFPEGQVTDKTERFIVSEIIRSKILELYRQEIPYSCEVEVESFKETEKIIRIRSNIYVARNTQKGIIIGNKGAAIKKLGIESRKDLETFFSKQIHIELFVKVKKDWRNNERMLKSFGY
ncbi:MAG TPA: GTPase Era [Bacteroidales bacterium]|jgi:GTP-binding protein Era|nr:GTPase Era [Bacteroidales bacterium]HXK80744.1 GTPase Era [Bacteroidales bacterium]